MERFYMEKRRDTFHYRGAFKRLGMKFDGEKRVWYAESREVLEAAYKLLRQELEPPSHGGQQVPQGGQDQGQQHADQGQQQDKPCQECGFTGGEHSKGCPTGRAEAAAAEDAAEAAQQEQGEGGEGGGQGGSGESDSPKPFAMFATASLTDGLTVAAKVADEALAKLVQGAKQGQQQQQKQQEQMKQQQEQMQKAVEQMKQEAQAEVEKTRKEVLALAQSAEPKKVEIRINEAPAVELEGEFVPECLGQIVAWLKCGFHVRLVGPAGTGKSKLGSLAAKVLERRFGFNNFSEGVDEASLYGFRDIRSDGTHYVVTEGSFADLFENGGIWLGDEFDRANTNVVVSLNGSLSEPHLLSLPKRTGATIARKHPEFGAIVTMNTWGSGPTAAYTSANRLDASTLDRFKISTLYVDYNRKLEQHLLPDGDLLRKIWDVRDKVMALGMQRVVSTRFIKDASTCVAQLDWTHDQVMRQLVLDWSPTDKQKVGLAHMG